MSSDQRPFKPLPSAEQLMAAVKRARAGIADAGSLQSALAERFQDSRAIEAFTARLSADQDIRPDDAIWLEVQLFAIFYDKMTEAVRGAGDLFRAHEGAMTELTNVVGAYSDHGAAAADRIEMLVDFVDKQRGTHDALLKVLSDFAQEAGNDLVDARAARKKGLLQGALMGGGGIVVGFLLALLAYWSLAK